VWPVIVESPQAAEGGVVAVCELPGARGLMAVATSPIPDEAFVQEAFTRQRVEDKLAHWRELLKQHDEGMTNCTLTRVEIQDTIDKWLDELLDLRGR
jgi:hypothetical protein